MPFLVADITTSQPAIRNHLLLLNGYIPLSKFTFRMEKRLASISISTASAWKVSIQIPRKVNFNLNMQCTLLIRAVSTLEHKHNLVHNVDGQKDNNSFLLCSDSNLPQLSNKSSREASAEMGEREKLRRIRISKANKGNVPWNKGRKHSAETLRRIRERTKLAMQDPKVKMKLVNQGHAQSEETRTKIGVGVRLGWQRRRKKLMTQETCCFQWQNLIAEASRRGFAGDEELQWDSYKILDKQLEQEWMKSIEQRKLMPRPKGSKRAPKSLEQRRRISAAISAKWADPGYRERVCSALAKYHGTPVGGKSKLPRRKPNGDTQSVKRSVKKKVRKASNDFEIGIKSQRRPKLKRRSAPSYKDPLADSKLEMIKNIRAQRVAMEAKKIEAMERAKLLISEAEKAAKALEVASLKSPLARASLMETRKLIAKANRSIEAIETGHTTIFKKKDINYSSLELSGRLNHYEKGNGGLTPPPDSKVNRTPHVPLSSNKGSRSTDLDFSKFTLQNLVNSGEEFEGPVVSPPLQPPNQLDPDELSGEKIVPKMKKWVCGRLVEVTE